MRAKNTYPRAQFYHLKGRTGPKVAIVAVANSMLGAIYYMIRDAAPYRDLGPDHFNRLDKNKLAARMVNKLQSLGFEVTLKEAA